MTFAEQFHKARLKSIPLIAVRTLDPAATIATLTQVTNGAPVLVWDCIRGIYGFNDPGRAVMAEAFREVDPQALANPIEALVRSAIIPPKAVLFFINGHTHLPHAGFIQAMWNLRDLFKQHRRTLCILGPSFTLPAEIVQDVLLLDEPMPDTAQLAAIVIESYQSANLPKPKDTAIMKSVDAITGLAAFSAEQMCALAMEPTGINNDALWEHKRQTIEATGGLEVYRGKERPADVKGAENVVHYLCGIQTSCIVFMDELDKMFSGMGERSGLHDEGTGREVPEMDGQTWPRWKADTQRRFTSRTSRNREVHDRQSDWQ